MVTATALMQLYEKGAFGLDDDVNGFLPFPVRNPTFPDQPITFRMLLAHASSITDNWDQIPYTWGGDSPIPLGPYLASYLVPGGTRYDAALSFGDWAPGSAQSYCNIGFALAGYLVERISGEPFDDYCREHIFRPLRMQAGWFLADFDLRHDPPAMQYDLDAATGEYVPYGYAGVPDYPDGQLRTDVVSLARFLISFADGGKVGPHARLLHPETLEMMQTVQFPEFGNKGLGVGFFDSGTGMQVGMFGLDYGATTGANVQIAERVGVIFLANGSVWTDAGWATLDDMAARLETEAVSGR
jgi:CubicO group peptidase (beta-lactamase class C family)